jgi:hypothetical protein
VLKSIGLQCRQLQTRNGKKHELSTYFITSTKQTPGCSIKTVYNHMIQATLRSGFSIRILSAKMLMVINPAVATHHFLELLEGLLFGGWLGPSPSILRVVVPADEEKQAQSVKSQTST